VRLQQRAPVVGAGEMDCFAAALLAMTAAVQLDRTAP
jgi:hypothetical protein